MLIWFHAKRVARGLASGMSGALPRLLLILLALSAVGTPAKAENCKSDDFARAVDQAGAALRDFNAENTPKIMAALKKLQQKNGWSDKDLEDKAIAFIHTPRIAELDEKTNDLLLKIDTLGDVEKSSLDCSKLAELQEAGRALLATMKEKSELAQANIAEKMQEGTIAAVPAPVLTQPPAPAQPAPAKPKRQDPPPHAKTPSTPSPAASRPVSPSPGPTPNTSQSTSPGPAGTWSAATSRTPPQETREASVPPIDDGQVRQELLPPSPSAGAGESGYTIDEIKAATRGVFGTISTSLGSVIEYAFSNYGRPSAYVIGGEGGGAFLAGARFGKGTLYMRTGQHREVYWHGPSLGYDFGAEGSRTLFLIYQLRDTSDLFRSFGGVDGSAYVLGGVGLTLLKGGPVFMTPIRTGVGLRLGANIGYVRFTPNATWNPF